MNSCGVRDWSSASSFARFCCARFSANEIHSRETDCMPAASVVLVSRIALMLREDCCSVSCEPLVTSEQEGRSNIMTMGWHSMLQFTPALVGCYIWEGNRSHAM